MLITIDCGNTNTVVGLYEGETSEGAFRHVYRFDTDAALDGVALAARFNEEVAGADLRDTDFTGAVIASVVPDALAGLEGFTRQITGADPVIVGAPGTALGLEVLLDNPSEVGADRLVNAVAAHALHDGPLILIDFGTATTFDVVTSDGDYAGGVIAPGINLALDALHDAAALLPRIEVARPERVIGTGTVGAMRSGIYWGYVGLIEGIVARIKAEYSDDGDTPFTVIATGGLAPLFADGTDVIGMTEPDLTLMGLTLVYRKNQPV
jgi:type III pantothenate kinase